MASPAKKIDANAFIKQNQGEALTSLHWKGSFQEYVDIVSSHPKVARTAFQRMCDMILAYGKADYIEEGEFLTHYSFFDDPINRGKDAIFGLDRALTKLVDVFKAGAKKYGTERRVILLHGPVGSSKSTICRLLKRGLERYSQTEEGALFSFEWASLSDGTIEKELFGETKTFPCPMHEEPLHLIPEEMRPSFLTKLNKGISRLSKIEISGDLCPPCRYIFNALLSMYSGDFEKVLQHVVIKRIILSEKDRVGIGTFQPKDEKNQDSTELTGDINYRKIALFGSDSDPRAFNFDGEFNIANRGMIEFIEVLKLDVAFLYDLLGASQEHVIKPKKFAQIDIDLVIVGHTNEPEYRKLQNNEFMEAFRDRTIKIDIPYITQVQKEMLIYRKDFNPERVVGKHIAPHTLEVASIWASLTRLEEPKQSNITLLQKLKLYNGEHLHGFSPHAVLELKAESSSEEGMRGISPRYVQDILSQVLVSDENQGCVNPFIVLRELEKGLHHHFLLSSDEQKNRYRGLIAIAQEEVEYLLKIEVQEAVISNTTALSALCSNYLNNIRAYVQREPLQDAQSGGAMDPNEDLMRSVEEKIGIGENRKDDFRREMINFMTSLKERGERFDWRQSDKLKRALELKLFEDQRDFLTLKANPGKGLNEEPHVETLGKEIRERLIERHGYCEICSEEALNFVTRRLSRFDSAVK